MYRLEPRRRGDVQLLGTALRGHGLKSILPRPTPWDPIGCNLFPDASGFVARERARRSRPLSPRVQHAL